MSEELETQEEIIDDQIDNDVEDQQEVEEKEDTPPGYLNYEQYVAKGGDPDLYRGPKAYSQYHELTKQVSSVKKSNRELMDGVNKMLANQEQSIKTQTEIKVKELQDKLDIAHEELDSKKAVKLQKQIDKLEQEPEKPRPKVAPTSHLDEVRDYQSEHPELDADSSQFNESLYKAVSKRLQENYSHKMTDREVYRLIKRSHKETLKDDPKFNQRKPRKPISSAAPNKKAGATKSLAVREKALDPVAAQIYNHHKSKGTPEGKAQAEEFLNNMGV
jgi:hypothetical protein